MNTVYTTQSHQSIMLGGLIAQGGEGSVWSVVGRPEVAKIYHPTMGIGDQEAKLSIMLANPPKDEMRFKFNHISIAWPTAMLFQAAKFSGFLMPRLGESVKILDVYNPKLRKARYPGFNWKYLLHTAQNLSIAIDAVHTRGYVVGDINESNIMVNRQALISLIDTDSFQVLDQSNGVYRCPVGREEFTPPELQGVQFNLVNRLPEHDYFGLAVMIFLLLMEGNHPFAGILKNANPTQEPANIYCLKQGAFPYASNSLSAPRPTAPRFTILPPDIQKLFFKSFVEGYRSPAARPSPGEWVSALDKAESRLTQCHKDQNHWFSSHLRRCPWCPAVPTRLQAPLPAVKAISHSDNRSPMGSIPRSGRPNSTSIANPAFLTSPQIPTASIGSVTVQARLKRFVYRSLGSTYFPLKQWWRQTRLSLLIGTACGAPLSFSVLLMFWYPDATSIIAAFLAGIMLFSPVFFLGRLVYNHLLRLNNPFGKAIGIMVLFGGLFVAIMAGYFTQALSINILHAYQPQFGWLLVESCLLGLGGGAGYGTYRFFARPKKNWMALLWLAFIAIFTLLVVGLVGSQFLPFQVI
jgi:serine/threonine protein kinase